MFLCKMRQLRYTFITLRQPLVGCHLPRHPGTFVHQLGYKGSGAVADEIEKKKTKYAHLEASHYFVPVVVESLGVFGPET